MSLWAARGLAPHGGLSRLGGMGHTCDDSQHAGQTGVAGSADTGLILASASPRRAALLAAAGIRFEVKPSSVGEVHHADWPGGALVEWNAGLKAAEVGTRFPGRLVLGADTLVFEGGVPLGKPGDMDEAAAMLRRLSGRTHEVMTGIAIARGGILVSAHAVTRVSFRPLDGGLIREYHVKVDPLDKAGAYGIQEHGGMIVSRVEGPLDNVVGLPVALVSRFLEAVVALP